MIALYLSAVLQASALELRGFPSSPVFVTTQSTQFKIAGNTSGILTLVVPAVAGVHTLTFPAGTTDFSATGGPSFVLRQSSAGAAITISQLAASDLTNGTSGSGAVALVTSPTFLTSTITPLIIGGAATTSTLTLRSTSGVGTTGADILFQVGNNGATEAMRILNNARIGIGVPVPLARFHINDGTNRNIRIWSDENNEGTTGINIQAFNDAASATVPVVLSGSLIALTQGNVGIGTITPPTGGGPALAFGQGANPTGIGANTAGIFVKDVAGTAELFGFDEAGNFPQLTPHPNEFLNTLPLKDRAYPWAYSAENAYLGKKIQVDMAGLVAAVERLSSEKFMYVSDITKQDWATNQAVLVERQKQKIAELTARVSLLIEQIAAEQDGEKKNSLMREKEKIIIPPPYRAKSLPPWMANRLLP